MYVSAVGQNKVPIFLHFSLLGVQAFVLGFQVQLPLQSNMNIEGVWFIVTVFTLVSDKSIGLPPKKRSVAVMQPHAESKVGHIDGAIACIAFSTKIQEFGSTGCLKEIGCSGRGTHDSMNNSYIAT